MRISFVVPIAAPPAVKLKRYGSIGDPPSTLKTDVANGRNSTAASAILLGGLGAAIAHLRIFLTKQKHRKLGV